MEKLILVFMLLGLGSIDNGSSEVYSNTDVSWNDPSRVYQRVKLKRENEVDHFSDDELLLKKMLTDTTIPVDIEKMSIIADRIISDADVSEETKRVVRQVKKQRPGFFWTLFRVFFETLNETRSVIIQINDIVTANVVERTTPRPTTLKADISEEDSTTTSTPFKLTRQFLQDFTRKNIRGLVRLFNIEWKDALNQSQSNIKQFQKELSRSVEPFLADNPDVY
ncbi:uncharacterized protein [Chelonus insularis]|nr:uncharacterized protein LOC118065612 isoform X2 [Chelonus insularis]